RCPARARRARRRWLRWPRRPQDADADRDRVGRSAPAPHPRRGAVGVPGGLASTGGARMSESRILLHVGAPKTGTSFVQDILFTHREVLRERGLPYLAAGHDAHFLARLDLLHLPGVGLEREPTGPGDAMAAEARACPAPVP